MKKMFISLFLTLTLVSSVYAGGRSTPRVESVTNATINSFTVNAYSIPAFTGNREWSIRFSSTTNVWYEIKNMPAVRSTTDSTPAPRNCTESSDMDCAIRITDYQLRDNQIKCGTRYSVVFRVTSLDQANTHADSPAVMINTPICSQTGVLGVTVPGLTQKDDTTMTLTARANISGFSGEQEAEFFFGIKEGDSQNVQITEYRSLGKKSGLSSIDFAADIPDLDCQKKYVYKIKVKVGSIETVVPSGTGVYRTGNTFECSTSLGTTTSTTQTEGPNIYTFLTPLPLGEGLTSTNSVIIGAAGETSQNGILGILQRIFTIMLVVAIILAVVFMIIGGARYATGDMMSAKIGGKEIITNAITGLLFALLAWLLLNIVNPDLLRFTLSIPNIGQKLTQGTGNTTSGGGSTNTIPGEGCSGFSTADNEACFERIKADELRVRGILREARITIERGDTACVRLGQEACTTVGLLSATTLDKLKQVKTSCPQCSVIITGATEFWLHGTAPEFRGNHRQFIAVDLKLGNSSFDSFIRSKTRVANPFDLCVETFSYVGLRFCNESRNHWHVDTVTTSGGSTTSGTLIHFENIGKNDLGVWGKATGQYHQVTIDQINGLIGATAPIEGKIRTAARAAGVDYKIFRALIASESYGVSQALNPNDPGVGACGLAQTLVSTARTVDRGLENRFANMTSNTAVCNNLRSDPDYSLKLGATYLKTRPGTSMKEKLAAYNGGTGRAGATGSSANCPGIMRFECPWEDKDASGNFIPSPCYNTTKPNDRPAATDRTDCPINEGYEVTRFYVDKILKTSQAIPN